MNRRKFLLGAGGLAAMAVAPIRFANANSTNVDSLLVFSDFEVDHFSDLLTPPDPRLLHLQPAGSTLDISTQYARNGTRCARSYLVQPARRAEIQPWGKTNDGLNIVLAHRRTHWIGFSVFVPQDWETNSKYGELIWQLSQYPENGNYKSPCVGGYIDCPGKAGTPNNYSIVVRSINDKPAVEHPRNEGLVTSFRNAEHSILDDRGKWTDWVIEYRPDHRAISEGGTGLIRIWKDGEKIVDFSGPNFYWSDTGVFWKMGCYKWDYANRGDDDVKSRTYFYDELRIARADLGNYELVAPKGGTSNPIPKSPIIELK